VIARAWRAWITWLDEREPAHALALFRVAIGCCLLALFGTAALRGVVDVAWVHRDFGGYRPLLEDTHWIWSLTGPQTPLIAWTAMGVLLVCGLLVVVGLGGRWPTLIALFLTTAFSRANGMTAGGYDSMLSNALWLLALSPATTSLSLDCRRKTGAWTSSAPVAAWPRRLLMYQLIIMYTWAGLQKVGAGWTPAGGFSALYVILSQPEWYREPLSFLPRIYPLTQVATALTWFWEILWPVMGLWLLLRRRGERGGRLRRAFVRADLRWLFLGVGLNMHALTWALMEVGPFSFLTVSYYLLFVTPDEWTRVWRWLSSKYAGEHGDPDADHGEAGDRPDDG
jgi:hypothetical protein